MRDVAVAEVLTAGGVRRSLRALKKQRKRKPVVVANAEAEALVGPQELVGFDDRLDPTTFRAWITIVRARTAGLTLTDISQRAGLDAELLNRIISSPVYMAFEADYRRVALATPEFDAAAQKLAAGVDKALDTLMFWMLQRDPDLAQVSLGAAKHWLAASGIDTERKRITKTTVSVGISADLSKRLKMGMGED